MLTIQQIINFYESLKKDNEKLKSDPAYNFLLDQIKSSLADYSNKQSKNFNNLVVLQRHIILAIATAYYENNRMISKFLSDNLPGARLTAVIRKLLVQDFKVKEQDISVKGGTTKIISNLYKEVARLNPVFRDHHPKSEFRIPGIFNNEKNSSEHCFKMCIIPRDEWHTFQKENFRYYSTDMFTYYGSHAQRAAFFESVGKLALAVLLTTTSHKGYEYSHMSFRLIDDARVAGREAIPNEFCGLTCLRSVLDQYDFQKHPNLKKSYDNQRGEMLGAYRYVLIFNDGGKHASGLSMFPAFVHNDPKVVHEKAEAFYNYLLQHPWYYNDKNGVWNFSDPNCQDIREYTIYKLEGLVTDLVNIIGHMEITEDSSLYRQLKPVINAIDDLLEYAWQNDYGDKIEVLLLNLKDRMCAESKVDPKVIALFDQCMLDMKQFVPPKLIAEEEVSQRDIASKST